ncbi:MAG: ABC transporter substrate-binding protein [Oceanipulchritudo sp.]
MNRQQKILAYATGFVLGCLILMALPRGEKASGSHPWHAQTAPEGTYPRELVDDLGRTVRLEKQPRHFISLAPSTTEILFAMGMGDHLMAVTRWCTYPEEADALREAGAQIGSMDQPNREMIASYRPDLIIGTDLTPPEIYAALENPPRTAALVLKHEGIDDIIEDVKTVGIATGVPGKALKLVQRLQRGRQAIQNRLQAVRELPPKRVLFLLSIEPGGQPGWAPGRDSWASSLIEAAHAVNVASEIGSSWGEVSLEALLTLDPEVLLIREADTAQEQARMEAEVAGLSRHPVWKEVQAVREGRIHWVPNGPLSIPGPRVIEAYSSVASAIWPDLPQVGQTP